MVDVQRAHYRRLPLPEDVTQLGEKIRRSLGNRIHDLCVSWHEDGWVLQGCAATYYAKQLAQEAVMHATPLPILANRIQVQIRRQPACSSFPLTAFVVGGSNHGEPRPDQNKVPEPRSDAELQYVAVAGLPDIREPDARGVQPAL